MTCIGILLTLSEIDKIAIQCFFPLSTSVEPERVTTSGFQERNYIEFSENYSPEGSGQVVLDIELLGVTSSRQRGPYYVSISKTRGSNSHYQYVETNLRRSVYSFLTLKKYKLSFVVQLLALRIIMTAF